MAKAVTDTKGLRIVSTWGHQSAHNFSESKGKWNLLSAIRVQRNQEPLDINLYASTDSVLNSNDELLGSLNRHRINLVPGESKAFNLNFATPKLCTPSAVAPGAYYLLAEVDSGKTIAESSRDKQLR